MSTKHTGGINGYSPTYARCRVRAIGHSWDKEHWVAYPLTNDAVLWVMNLECTRCGATKWNELDGRLQRTGRKGMAYPDGYLATKDEPISPDQCLELIFKMAQTRPGKR